MRRGGLTRGIDAGAVPRVIREWDLAECSEQLGDTRRFNAAVLAPNLADHTYFHATSHKSDFYAQFHTRGDLNHLLEPV